MSISIKKTLIFTGWTDFFILYIRADPRQFFLFACPYLLK